MTWSHVTKVEKIKMRLGLKVEKFQAALTENSSAGAEWGETLRDGIRLAPVLSFSFCSHSPLLHLMS